MIFRFDRVVVKLEMYDVEVEAEDSDKARSKAYDQCRRHGMGGDPEFEGEEQLPDEEESQE